MMAIVLWGVTPYTLGTFTVTGEEPFYMHNWAIRVNMERVRYTEIIIKLHGVTFQ